MSSVLQVQQFECVGDEVSRQVRSEGRVLMDTRDECVVENDRLGAVDQSACRRMGV